MILDLLIRADDDPSSHPYEDRRQRLMGGDVVHVWKDITFPGFGFYGVQETTADKFVIVRIPDALDGDEALFLEVEFPTIAPHLTLDRGRRRRRQVKLQDFTTARKNVMRNRLLPDVDIMTPENKQIFIDGVPGIEMLGQGQRRSTVWDIEVPRADFMALVEERTPETKDAQGRPIDGNPRKHGFKDR